MTSIIAPLRRAVVVGGDQIAVRCGEHELTYEQTWERVRRLVAALRALGVRNGDRVAIVSRNCHRYVEVYQAIPAAGMVLVPLNHRHTAAELRYALEDSETKVLFAGEGADVPDDTVEHVFNLDDEYEALIASAPADDLGSEPTDHDLAGLFYTGGTTGKAKGVMLSHRNLIANALCQQATFRFEPETRWLLAAPMFHAAGTVALLATVWHAGRHVVLPAFEPGAALDLIEREGVTATLIVPTMVAALSEEQLARPRDISSFEMLSHGGSPIATETVRRAHQAFPGAELMHLYGCTETAPIATFLGHEEELLDQPQIRSCGHPAIGVEISIVDSATGAQVPTGEVGEVSIRGDNVMLGYWNKPEASAQALIDGWYRTGDLGRIDVHGYVYLVDRAKDMIVTGAENVYSTEVEEALYTHSAVLEAAVFGVPHEHWGEAVYAVVVPRGEVSEEELIAHCRGQIAGYKVPKQIELRYQPLPKSGAGKVLKRELRAPHWDGRTELVAGA